jgi:hypothetical protein
MAGTAARVSSEDLTREVWRLLGDSDGSVLSSLLEAQTLASLALIEEIRLLRDEIRKGKKAVKVPAKDIRPGDRIEVAGSRRIVKATYDHPPEESESSCFMRPGQVWLRLGKREVLAMGPDELVLRD